jgi:hypothetical protein
MKKWKNLQSDILEDDHVLVNNNDNDYDNDKTSEWNWQCGSNCTAIETFMNMTFIWET